MIRQASPNLTERCTVDEKLESNRGCNVSSFFALFASRQLYTKIILYVYIVEGENVSVAAVKFARTSRLVQLSNFRGRRQYCAIHTCQYLSMNTLN